MQPDECTTETLVLTQEDVQVCTPAPLHACTLARLHACTPAPITLSAPVRSLACRALSPPS